MPERVGSARNNPIPLLADGSEDAVSACGNEDAGLEPAFPARNAGWVLRPAYPALRLRVGSFLRFALAMRSSSFPLMDFAMLREAPFRLDFDRSPRLAERAAPAAICCFF